MIEHYKLHGIDPLSKSFKYFKCNQGFEKAMLISALRRIKKTEIKNRNYNVYIAEAAES